MGVSAAPAAAAAAASVAPVKGTVQVEPHLRPTPPVTMPKPATAATGTPAADPAKPAEGAAATATGAATAPAAAAPAQDPKITEQFAALMRRDKELRDRESRLTALESEAKKGASLVDGIKKDPIKALKEIGISFEALADTVLNNGKPTAKQELDALREELAGVKKQLADRDNESKASTEAQAVAVFKNDIRKFVDEHKDGYELIAAEGQYDLVYRVIEQHYSETGKILDVKEAAEHTEKWLTEQRKPLLSLKKFQTPPTDPNAPQGAKGTEQGNPGQKADTGPTTLTNTQAGNGPPRGQKEKLSRSESIRRAASVLRFKSDK